MRFPPSPQSTTPSWWLSVSFWSKPVGSLHRTHAYNTRNLKYMTVCNISLPPPLPPQKANLWINRKWSAFLNHLEREVKPGKSMMFIPLAPTRDTWNNFLIGRTQDQTRQAAEHNTIQVQLRGQSCCQLCEVFFFSVTLPRLLQNVNVKPWDAHKHAQCDAGCVETPTPLSSGHSHLQSPPRLSCR